MRLYTLLFLWSFLIGNEVYADDSLWVFQQQNEIEVKGIRKIIPEIYLLVQLNDSIFKQIQKSISEGKPIELFIPSPDGRIRVFQVSPATSMATELAEKYPFIKTYTAIEKDNTMVSAKMDYTGFGFHAMVLDGEDTYFIDPYTDVNTGYYSCYYKRNYNKSPEGRMREKPVHKKSCKRHKSLRK